MVYRYPGLTRCINVYILLLPLVNVKSMFSQSQHVLSRACTHMLPTNHDARVLEVLLDADLLFAVLNKISGEIAGIIHPWESIV